MSYTKLFDPPQDGATPLDGEGNPRSSSISDMDVAKKLAVGFTRDPVGTSPSAPEPVVAAETASAEEEVVEPETEQPADAEE